MLRPAPLLALVVLVGGAIWAFVPTEEATFWSTVSPVISLALAWSVSTWVRQGSPPGVRTSMAPFEQAKQFFARRGVEVRDASGDGEAFGSWKMDLPSTPPIRLIWDGKDQWFVIERRTARTVDGQPVWDTLWTGLRGANQNLEEALSTTTKFLEGKQ